MNIYKKPGGGVTVHALSSYVQHLIANFCLFQFQLLPRLRYASPAALRRPKPNSMIRIIASIFTTLLTIVMTLAAMYILVWATEYVTSLESQIQRATAMGAELLLGVVLLLGTGWLATHLAVRIFSPKDGATNGGAINDTLAKDMKDTYQGGAVV